MNIANIPGSLCSGGAGSLCSQAITSTTWGAIGNIGYRFEAGRYFVEPVLSGEWSSNSMGNLDLAGAQVVEQFANNQKIDLGGGARFGGTVVDDKVHYLEASFVGRVWDIVSSPNKVSITNLGPTIALQDNVFSTVYGEAGFQLDWLNRYSGWSAYVRADGKFNNQFQTFTGKAGVRYAF